MKNVTVRDVVKATGYSRASVYAALKNDPNMSDKAKELIQAKARALGYSVDPVLSALGRTRWKFSEAHHGANLVFFLEGFEVEHGQVDMKNLIAYAKERGFGLSFMRAAQFKSVEQANRELRAKGVRGIAAALLSTLHSVSFVAKLDVTHMAVIGGEGNRDVFHTVAHNWAAMISLLIEKLLQRGYKKISIVLYENDPLYFYDGQRIGAVLFAQWKFGVPIKLHTLRREWSEKTPLKRATYKDSTEELGKLLKKEDFDALIGWSDGEYWMLKDLGYQIPEDVGYVSLVSGGESTGMASTSSELCKREIDRLIEMIRNQEFGRPANPVTSLHMPKFIDQGTA